MTKPEYEYAISGLAFEEAKGDSHQLFRKNGEAVEVRVNRFMEQEEVFRPTTMQISLPGTDVEEYISAIRRLSEGLSEVTVATYTPMPSDFEEGEPAFECDGNSASPRLVVTGWSAELTEEQKELLKEVQFF